MKAWLDKKTGLIWELKTPENVDDLFSWDETLIYVEKLNRKNFGGFNDWRVPTIDELSTIRTKERNNGKFIKKELSENCSSRYWSSTTGGNYKEYAWYVNFGDGNVYGNGKDYNLYVRCVRSEK